MAFIPRDHLYILRSAFEYKLYTHTHTYNMHMYMYIYVTLVSKIRYHTNDIKFLLEDVLIDNSSG